MVATAKVALCRRASSQYLKFNSGTELEQFLELLREFVGRIDSHRIPYMARRLRLTRASAQRKPALITLFLDVLDSYVTVTAYAEVATRACSTTAPLCAVSDQ
jgi:DNA polymerase III epsilon subunit-like protein